MPTADIKYPINSRTTRARKDPVGAQGAAGITIFDADPSTRRTSCPLEPSNIRQRPATSHQSTPGAGTRYGGVGHTSAIPCHLRHHTSCPYASIPDHGISHRHGTRHRRGMRCGGNRHVRRRSQHPPHLVPARTTKCPTTACSFRSFIAQGGHEVWWRRNYIHNSMPPPPPHLMPLRVNPGSWDFAPTWRTPS